MQRSGDVEGKLHGVPASVSVSAGRACSGFAQRAKPIILAVYGTVPPGVENVLPFQLDATHQSKNNSIVLKLSFNY